MSGREISDAELVIQRLYAITSSYGQGFASQLRELLALGCERFSLDIGIVSQVQGNQYKVVESYGLETRPSPGTLFDLSDTYCEVTLRAKAPIGFAHAHESELKTHPCYLQLGLEAYIGTPIENRLGTFGTLNFSSVKRHTTEFRQVDLEALQLMATWIGGELERQALEERMSTIHGMIPICASCKKIRSSLGDWQALERYLGEQAQMEFTHGVCPDCIHDLM